MNLKNMLKRYMVLIVVLVLTTSLIGVTTLSDPVPKTIFGQVDPDLGGAVAYPGTVVFYIQNRTSEMKDNDVMYQSPPPPPLVEYYGSAIEDTIIDWEPGDPGIVVVNVEHGTYPGGDRIGYVAYSGDTLDDTGSQTFPTVELQKIPVPQFADNGIGYINFSWTPLSDPLGLIAGYVVYRSETNSSDLDWGVSPIGGNINSPITNDYYIDGSAVGGTTYYYAIKVVFNGIVDEPSDMTVDNHECQYFGEGSAPMSSVVSGYTVDYFNLTTGGTPDGPLLVNEIRNVGKTVQIWASGYNNSINPNPYVSPVVVDWSQSPSLGWFSTYLGDTTIFTAGYYQGGTTTITGQNTTMTPTTDTGDITVNAPTVDYINLTYSPNGTEIEDQTRNTNDPLLIYASGYNITAKTYVRLVDVTWSNTPVLGNFDVAIGTSSTYTGTLGGLTTIKGENTSMTPIVSDIFQLNLIAPPEIDRIDLTYDPNGVSIPDSLNLAVGGIITVYASGYNISTGLYVNLVNVDWTLTPIGDLGYIDNITGTSTTFFANLTGGGPINLLGTSVTAPDLKDQFNITILNPTVDYILIRSGDMGGGKNLSDPANYPTYPLNYSTMLFGAEYNYTAGYIGPVSDTSTWSSNAITIATVTTPGNRTTVKCNETNAGVATITLNDGVRQTTTQITVMQVTVDYIQIRDESGGGGNVISNPSYPVGAEDILYGARYNYTVDYIGDVPITSTWVSTDNSIVSVISPGGQTTITCSDTNWGTITLTLTDVDSGKSNTTQITVLEPTVDYILIVDTAATGATEIADQTVDVGVKIMGYAASFNNTALYIGDVQVGWDVTNAGGAAALTDPDTGESSEFDSHNAGGTATWIAQYAVGITDEVVFTINAPTVDYIQIRTEASGLGEVVTTAEFNLDGVNSAQYYCAAYNLLAGYIGDVSAEWTVTGGIGTVVASGQFTVFTATTAGTGTITATHTYDSTDVTNVTGDISVYTKPTTPTGLQVQQVAAGGALNLVWSANPEGYVDGYDIWRSLTNVSGSFELIAESVTGTSYQNTGLTNGETYYYYIVAVGDYLAPNASDPSVTVHNVADADTDGDDIFNLQDDDDDGDGLLDTEEDKNGDGLIEGDTNNNRIWDNGEDWKETDPLNSDTDGDGHNDKEDEYPLDPNKWKKEEEEFPVLLVLIPIIIIIIVLILLMLLLKKRKPAEIPAVPEEERELPPPPGAPLEEEEGALPEEEELPPEEEAPLEGEEEILEEEMPPEEELPESEKETPP